MFRQSAPWYDAVYAPKAYGDEADHVLGIATQRMGHAPTSVLDVACGTGRHLERWQSLGLDVAGVDIDEGLLAVAQARLPGVVLQRADMRDFDCGRHFELVTNLFSSIGYLLTDDDLVAAIRAMRRHLVPGGVLVIEPWITPDAWDDTPRAHPEQYVSDDWTVMRLGVNHREGTLTTLVMHHLVSDGREIRHLVDEHTLRLRSFGEYADAFGAAGLIDVQVDAEGIAGRGLVIGTAP